MTPLLEKCLHGLSQNRNESFNGTIWNRIPKGTYVGLRQLEIGVYDAIAHFNIGSEAAILVYEKTRNASRTSHAKRMFK